MATDLERRFQEPTDRVLPLLMNGDRLTQAEFLRRYHAMPDVSHAELIVEVAASTVSYDLHEKFNAYRRNGVKE